MFELYKYTLYVNHATWILFFNTVYFLLITKPHIFYLVVNKFQNFSFAYPNSPLQYTENMQVS